MFPQFCNKCFTYNDSEPELKYYIWRCMHITCNKCVVDSTTCPICGKRSKPTSLIDGLTTLEDPIALSRKFESMYKLQIHQEALQLNFLINKLPSLIEEYNQAKENIMKYNKRIDEIIEKEKLKANKMKKYIEYYSLHYQHYPESISDKSGNKTQAKHTGPITNTFNIMGENSTTPTISDSHSNTTFEIRSEQSAPFNNPATNNNMLSF